MRLYLGIYIYMIWLWQYWKKKTWIIFISIVLFLRYIFKSIFLQEFMATQDSVQLVKEDVIAAVLHVSPKWTMFDKPVVKVDFKIYQSGLCNFHIKFGYNIFSANMSNNLLQCILTHHDIHIVATIKNSTAVKVLSKNTDKLTQVEERSQCHIFRRTMATFLAVNGALVKLILRFVCYLSHLSMLISCT